MYKMQKQMVLRSKSITTLNETSNMASKDKDNSQDTLFKTPAKQQKGEKTVKADKPVSTKKKLHNETHVKDMQNGPLNRSLFDKEITRGMVAERVKHLNSTPETSPVKTQPTSSNKKKMLSTRNGQLVVEEDSSDTEIQLQKRNRLQHDLLESRSNDPFEEFQHDQQRNSETDADSQQSEDEQLEEDPPNDLRGILRDLVTTVKRLDRSVSKMNKDRASTDRQVGAIQAIQSQDLVKIRGLVDKLDDQEDKINALIGIVVRQDQQIKSLTSRLEVNYAKENKDNLLINGVPETQNEDCYREAANFFRNVLKIDKPIHLT